MIKNFLKTALLGLAFVAGTASSQVIFADSFDVTKLKSIDFTDDSSGAIKVKNPQFNSVTGLLTVTRDTGTTPPVDPNPPVSCDVTPAGWNYISTSDNRVMNYGATFPGHSPWTSPSWVQPVGSFTTATRSNPSGKVMTGQLIAVKAAVGTRNTNIGFAGSQPQGQSGYGGGYPADYAAVSVSKCKGDIAPRRIGDATRCVFHSGSLEGRLIFGPTAIAGCNFPAGTDVWVTFWFPNRDAPLDPTRNGCVNANKCNVNVTIR